MNYQSLIAQAGVGLAYQVFGNELPDQVSGNLSFAEEREVFKASGDHSEKEVILGRMVEKATNFKQLRAVLGESPGYPEVREKVFSKLMRRDLKFGHLERISKMLALSEDEERKLSVLIEMFRRASSVPQLLKTYNYAFEFRKLRVEVLQRAVAEAASFEEYLLLIPVVQNGPCPEFEELLGVLLEKLGSCALSFGQWFMVVEASLNAFSIFTEEGMKQMRGKTPSLDELLVVMRSPHSHLGVDKLLGQKISECNFTIPELSAIYRASNRRYHEVDNVVIQKIRALAGKSPSS